MWLGQGRTSLIIVASSPGVLGSGVAPVVLPRPLGVEALVTVIGRDDHIHTTAVVLHQWLCGMWWQLVRPGMVVCSISNLELRVERNRLPSGGALVDLCQNIYLQGDAKRRLPPGWHRLSFHPQQQLLE